MKHFLVVGAFLYVKCKVQPRFRDDENLEFKIYNMQLLSEIRDKLTNNITLNISLEKISDDFINKINELIKAHPGKCGLKFAVEDSSERISVDMPSKKFRVAPSHEFISSLEAEGMEYKLN